MDYALIVKLTNNCNLNCSYCYHRRDLSRDMQSSLRREEIEKMIARLLEHNERHAEFIWHGGEPLLAGLDTFRFIVEKQAQYNVNGLAIRNSVQTNGTLLTQEDIDFFNDNHFSVGISIDGPFDMHSAERGTTHSEYAHILRALDALREKQLRHGTLCVVGKQHVGQARRVYELMTEHHIDAVGFLPCVVQDEGVVDSAKTISPEEYGRFLIDFFEAWVHGQRKGMTIRNFDDCIRYYRGHEPTTCVNCNRCDSYLTVLPGGGIYLCDNFSASAEHQVSTIERGFDGIENTLPMQWLRNAIDRFPAGCERCRLFSACHGGCKYHRWIADQSMMKKQFYCRTQQMLYEHIGKYFGEKEENKCGSSTST